jgi:hypothetical protein
MVDGWLTQLAADAAGDPNIDHSIDGETISPTAWRESLWSKIKETNAMINVLNGPWVIRSRGRAV